MASVWVVTAGKYSDYHIVAVFADEDTARSTAEAMNPNGPDDYGAHRVQEWPVGEIPWQAHYKATTILEDGAVLQDTSVEALRTNGPQDPYSDVSDDGPGELWALTYPHGRWERNMGKTSATCFLTIYADAPEKARKAAGERAHQILAEWPVHVEAARERGDLD